MALMIYFNLPLAILPCKSQIWNFFSADVSLAEAPWATLAENNFFLSHSSRHGESTGTFIFFVQQLQPAKKNTFNL
jgi:hypothetical protein